VGRIFRPHDRGRNMDNLGKNIYEDASCKYMRERYQLSCPAVLATEKVFEPGAVIHPPAPDSKDQRISLPLRCRSDALLAPAA
ncbi:MAG: hypothetical protein VW338_01580, partial [Rhodospirillaceae bacterium]